MNKSQAPTRILSRITSTCRCRGTAVNATDSWGWILVSAPPYEYRWVSQSWLPMLINPYPGRTSPVDLLIRPCHGQHPNRPSSPARLGLICATNFSKVRQLPPVCGSVLSATGLMCSAESLPRLARLQPRSAPLSVAIVLRALLLPVVLLNEKWRDVCSFRTPTPASTDFVKYPWSPTVYAVTFWPGGEHKWLWTPLS